MNASAPAAPTSATLSDREREQIAAANAAGQTPVVFVHGLWLLASSWERWADLFEAAGHPAVLAEWPGDAASVEEAHRTPDSSAGRSIGEVAERVAGLIGELDRKPAIVGHSFGGSIAQILAGRGLSAATVAVAPAPVRGVLPMPLTTLRALASILANPLNRGRAVTLDFDAWRYAWGNALAEGEARGLYETFAVPAPALPLFQAAVANLNPATDLKVDVRTGARGPMLFISGDADHVTPPAVIKAAYKRQRGSSAVTEIAELEGRGHSLTIDSRWRELAQTALEFVSRFA
jgi:non-heme chloroperoxidase